MPFQKRVNQKSEDLGFSTTTMRPNECANVTICATNSYSMLAAETLALSLSPNPGNPSGHTSDLKGFGPRILRPFSSRNWMFLAREHVPQGGAKKTPTTKGDLIHFMKSCWSVG
jgi:hypothetical protein